jgi:hypothetical protein
MSTRRIVTRMITISLVLVALIVVVLGLGQVGLLDTVFRPGPVKPVDFATLQRPTSPNTYLVAPDGFTPVKSDAEAPVLGLSTEKLKANWEAMVARQPDVEKVAESADGLQIDYIQRTKLMRYPDWITVRFIPMPSDPETGDYATLAVYSRSVYGHGDMGANKARITKWLGGL